MLGDGEAERFPSPIISDPVQSLKNKVQSDNHYNINLVPKKLCHSITQACVAGRCLLDGLAVLRYKLVMFTLQPAAE